MQSVQSECQDFGGTILAAQDSPVDEEEITWRPRHGYIIRPWLVVLPIIFIWIIYSSIYI